MVCCAPQLNDMDRVMSHWRSVRGGARERSLSLPGDDLIPFPIKTLTHAITIAAAPDAVWPWIAQMGAGTCAGCYSYDLFDNGGHQSSVALIPELQQLGVGTVFPALPGVTDGFVVLAFEPGRWPVLGWPSPEGPPAVTWTFVLEAIGTTTRRLVRARATGGYRFRGLPQWVSPFIAALVHFLMERGQLRGIARRAEAVEPAG